MLLSPHLQALFAKDYAQFTLLAIRAYEELIMNSRRRFLLIRAAALDRRDVRVSEGETRPKWRLMMINVMILVCSVGTQPMDCQKDTAVDVIKGPTAANEIQCAIYGQQFLAQVAHLLDAKTYPKITCTRVAAADQQAGRPPGSELPRESQKYQPVGADFGRASNE